MMRKSKIDKMSIQYAQKKIDKAVFKCLHPKCNENAIKGHALHKEGILRKMTDDGHLYSMNPSMMQGINKSLYDPLDVIKIGIEKVTLFRGYCNYHDTELFKDIEVKKLEVNNKKQEALLFLRAISHEHRVKEEVLLYMNERIRYIEKNFGGSLDNYKEKLYKEEFLENISGPYIRSLINIIEEERFHEIRTIWKTFNKNIGVASLGMQSITPSRTYDLKVNALLNNNDSTYSFHIIPDMDKTHLIISCLSKNSIKMHDYFGNLHNLEKEEMESLLNELAFEKVEHSVISPTVWENLDDDLKEDIMHSIRAPENREFDFVPDIIKL